MIPNSIEELFDNKDYNYYLVDYNLQPMNNIESMDYFLEQIGVLNNNIIINDNTYVVLAHPNYNYKLEIQSGGTGDFFSHVWEVNILN